MRKAIKMLDIIRHLPAGKKFYFAEVKGLRMTASNFSARIKDYITDGTIKRVMIGKRVQYFISAHNRTSLMDLLSKPGTEKAVLKNKMFDKFMRA